MLNCDKIRGVLYTHEYRDRKGIDLLMKAGVPTICECELGSNYTLLDEWKFL
jgi:hypothetical protein